VSDAKTNKEVPFATIVFTGTSIGISSNVSGHFVLSGNTTGNKISISHTGYAGYFRAIDQRLPAKGSRRPLHLDHANLPI
jgi:hypothetical protein